MFYAISENLVCVSLFYNLNFVIVIKVEKGYKKYYQKPKKDPFGKVLKVVYFDFM